MSHLWTKHICIESPLKHLPIDSTLTLSVLTLDFTLLPLVSHFSILEKLCHLLCHRLWVITILQVVLPVSLLVSCFCSKVVIAWVSFYVDPFYESSLSYTVSVWSLAYVSSTHSGSVLMLDDVGCINALLPTVSPHRLQLIIWNRD